MWKSVITDKSDLSIMNNQCSPVNEWSGYVLWTLEFGGQTYSSRSIWLENSEVLICCS